MNFEELASGFSTQVADREGRRTTTMGQIGERVTAAENWLDKHGYRWNGPNDKFALLTNVGVHVLDVEIDKDDGFIKVRFADKSFYFPPGEIGVDAAFSRVAWCVAAFNEARRSGSS